MKNKIKVTTIARLSALAIVWINQILALFGKNIPVIDTLAYQIASILITLVVSAWAAWKNNDITKFARTAGKVLDALRDGKITTDETQELLDSADVLMTAEDDEDNIELNDDNAEDKNL